MKCLKCGKEADYIFEGTSYCQEHYGNRRKELEEKARELKKRLEEEEDRKRSFKRIVVAGLIFAAAMGWVLGCAVEVLITKTVSAFGFWSLVICLPIAIITAFLRFHFWK